MEITVAYLLKATLESRVCLCQGLIFYNFFVNAQSCVYSSNGALAGMSFLLFSLSFAYATERPPTKQESQKNPQRRKLQYYLHCTEFNPKSMKANGRAF